MKDNRNKLALWWFTRILIWEFNLQIENSSFPWCLKCVCYLFRTNDLRNEEKKIRKWLPLSFLVYHTSTSLYLMIHHLSLLDEPVKKIHKRFNIVVVDRKKKSNRHSETKKNHGARIEHTHTVYTRTKNPYGWSRLHAFRSIRSRDLAIPLIFKVFNFFSFCSRSFRAGRSSPTCDYKLEAEELLVVSHSPDVFDH